MNVKLITNESDLAAWNNFVLQSPQVSPFVSTVWIEAIRQSLGIQADIHALYKGDDIISGTVLYHKISGSKKQSVLPPLTPYTPFVYRPISSSYPSKVTAEHITITRELITQIQNQYSGVQLLLMPSTNDIRPWLWEKWSAVPCYTYIIDLSEELNLSHSVRKQVKKCERNGFTVNEQWDLDNFWKIYEKTQLKQGFDLGMDRDQFFKLVNFLHNSNMALMVTALDSEKQLVSSRIEVLLPETDIAFDWVAGSDPDFLNTGATPWLMVKTADILTDKGFTKLDLCGADFESIARFKSELGGSLVQYFRVISPLSPWQKIGKLIGSIFKK